MLHMSKVHSHSLLTRSDQSIRIWQLPPTHRPNVPRPSASGRPFHPATLHLPSPTLTIALHFPTRPCPASRLESKTEMKKKKKKKKKHTINPTGTSPSA